MAETNFAGLIEPIARRLLGEPNARLSSKDELRYGTRGSLVIDLKKGTFFDHETGQGGGALDLITRETGRTGADRLQWLEQNGIVNLPPISERRKANAGGTEPRIIVVYSYCDEAGGLLFDVVR